MRAALILASAVFLLTGCSADKPEESLVSRIEHVLSHDPCLRKIATMRRTYQFARRGNEINRDLIEVDIEEAGHRGRPAGRYIEEPESGGLLDDSQFFTAHATYRVSSGDMDLWACGMNFGGIRHPPRL
jgi:hypothetical protein